MPLSNLLSHNRFAAYCAASLFCVMLIGNAHAALNGITVGVDPGHGGGDPGAMANGLNEKDVNLATALALRDFLKADGATVIMSRSTDKSLTSAVSGKTELVARARFFNSKGVDYMISTHHNSAQPEANGALVYITRGACDRTSGKIAGEVLPEMIKASGLRAKGGANGPGCPGKPGVFQWNATVITDTSMPAVLTETSFITHPGEAEKLRDPEYIRHNGWAIYAGFVEFIGRTPLPYKPLNPLPDTAPDTVPEQPSIADTVELQLQDREGKSLNGKLNWDETPVGDESSVEIQILNSGVKPWTLSWRLESGETSSFRTVHACAETLAGGELCALQVVFSPKTVGDFSDALHLMQGESILSGVQLSATAIAVSKPPSPVLLSAEFVARRLDNPLRLSVVSVHSISGAQYRWIYQDKHFDGSKAEIPLDKAGRHMVELRVSLGDREVQGEALLNLLDVPVLCRGRRCTVGNGTTQSCTENALRKALTSGNEVDFHCGEEHHTLVLTRTLEVTRDTLIHGGGLRQGGRISLSGQDQVRILHVAESTTLNLYNLGLVHGRGQGEEGAGGAVFAAGSNKLEIVNCVLEGNDGSAGTWLGGGGAVAVRSFSRLNVDNSLFVNNKGLNGAALNTLLSEVSIRNSTFTDNDSRAGASYGGGFGGALYFDGAGDNQDKQGGLILIEHSAFRNNRATGQGGAVFSFVYPPDEVQIDNSRFDQNVVQAGQGNEAAGGAIWHGNGKLSVTRSGFYGNHAIAQGGALWLDGVEPALLENLTFAGNRALTDGQSGFGGIGGAITGGGNFTCRHCSFVANHAGNEGGAIYGNRKVLLQNSLFAGNTALNNGAAQVRYATCAGQMQDGGHNMQFPGVNPAHAGDTLCAATIRLADPLVDKLDYYGGNTPLAGLKVSSPALDAFTGDTCAATDQRGILRPQVAKDGAVPACDIGAFEYTADPVLRNAVAFNGRTLQPLSTQAHFIPVLRGESGAKEQQARFKQDEFIRIAGTIQVDPLHIGKSAQLMAAVLHTPAHSDESFWLMRNNTEWLPWNGEWLRLSAAETRDALREQETLSAFQGRLQGMPGKFSVHIGYRLEGDIFIFNSGHPIEFIVE